MKENFVLLLDIYGELLPQSQREALDMRYNADLSLSEIAEEKGGIARQSVSDACRKGEKRLLELEKVLGNAKRLKTLSEKIDSAEKTAELLRTSGNEKLTEQLVEILESMRREL